MGMYGGKHFANPAVGRNFETSKKADPMPRDPGGQAAAGGEEHNAPGAHSVVIHKAADKFHTVAMHPQGVTTKEHGSMREAMQHAERAMSGGAEQGQQDPAMMGGGENEWMGGR